MQRVGKNMLHQLRQSRDAATECPSQQNSREQSRGRGDETPKNAEKTQSKSSSGAGVVEYYGSPAITQRNSGLGVLKYLGNR